MFLTHLNLSFFPLILSFLLFFFFFFLVMFFQYSIHYWFIFFILFVSFCFIFFYIYSFECYSFSFLQFFFNSQFFIFFVLSEVFFFIGVFWSLFWIIFSYDSCFFLSISVIYPFGLALFNTFLLLLSSSFAVIYHLNYLNFILDFSLLFCMLAGLWFLINQIIEFFVCFYTISDYSFCSIFFFGTGFHGFHVFVGLVLLFLCYVSDFLFSLNITFYLNCSLLYWHFVDVIWLFLFTFIYIFVYYLFFY